MQGNLSSTVVWKYSEIKWICNLCYQYIGCLITIIMNFSINFLTMIYCIIKQYRVRKARRGNEWKTLLSARSVFIPHFLSFFLFLFSPENVLRWFYRVGKGGKEGQGERERDINVRETLICFLLHAPWPVLEPTTF